MTKEMATLTNDSSNNKKFTRNQFLRLLGKLFLGMSLMMTTGTILGYWMLKRWLIKQRDQIIRLQKMHDQIFGRFEQTKDDISHTVNELIPVMKLVLNKNGLNLDRLLQTLKEEKQRKKDGSDDVLCDKKKLWDDLKLKSLIKLITIIYMITNLQILITIQLNILARRDYLEKVIKETIKNQNESHPIYSSFNNMYCWIKQKVWDDDENLGKSKDKQLGRDHITYVNEQGYLSISWWLINRGWEEYYKLIENIVTIELNGLDVKDKITKLEFNNLLERIIKNTNSRIISSINDNSCGDSNTSIILEEITLPDESMEAYTLQQILDGESMALLYSCYNNEDQNNNNNKNNRKLISQLLTETRGHLRKRGVHKVMESIINELFEVVVESIGKKIDIKYKMTKKKKKNEDGESEKGNSDQTNENVNKYPVAMFTLAIKECCAELLSESNGSNNIINIISATEDLGEFANCVYSNYEI